MYFTIRHFAAVLVGAAAVAVSVSGMACPPTSTDSSQIKPILDREIVHRLDARSPGLGTLLHGAGLRWSEGVQSVGEPAPRPEPQPKPWPVPSPRPKPWPWPWPDPEKPWPGPGPVPEPMDPQMWGARPWV